MGATTGLGQASIAVSSAGGFFSSSTGTLPSLGAKTPSPNVLSGFASYNYLFSLHALTKGQLNFPDQSYIKGILPPTIASSGFRNPSDRYGTAGEKFDFFINDVRIVNTLAPQKGVGNAVTINLEFTVTEPYSMGGFLVACQAAAKDSGYANYNNAPFLLVIQFRGNTESGTMVNIPNTSKFIPFRFNKTTMKVTEAGAVYQCECVAINQEALNDSKKLTLKSIRASGKTVQEILQSGDNSLQKALNDQYKAQVKNKEANQPSVQFAIVFPKIDALGQTFAGPGLGTTQQEVLTAIGVSVVNPNQDKENFVQDEDKVSELGKAELGFDLYRPGTRPPADMAVIWDKDKGFIKDTQSNDPGLVSFQFAENMDIVSIINQVLYKSSLAKKLLDEVQIGADGMRPFWRIDTQVYHYSDKANEDITNTPPMLVVYSIVPFYYHSSRYSAPNADMIGKEIRTSKAPKHYNYIYSGVNTELRSIDVTFEQAFYRQFFPDNAKNTGGRLVQVSNSTVKQKPADQNLAIVQPVSEGKDAVGYAPVNAANNKVTLQSDKQHTQPGDLDDHRIAALILNGFQTTTGDMVNIQATINGDPFYISNSGIGNYRAQVPMDNLMVTKDGDINFLTTEVDVQLSFRTPSDIIQDTGMYNRKSELSAMFSGLYCINTVESKFSNGDFTQVLELFRRPGQEQLSQFGTAAKSAILTNKKASDTEGKAK